MQGRAIVAKRYRRISIMALAPPFFQSAVGRVRPPPSPAVRTTTTGVGKVAPLARNCQLSRVSEGESAPTAAAVTQAQAEPGARRTRTKAAAGGGQASPPVAAHADPRLLQDELRRLDALLEQGNEAAATAAAARLREASVLRGFGAARQVSEARCTLWWGLRLLGYKRPGKGSSACKGSTS
jgi:hypothetical protein